MAKLAVTVAENRNDGVYPEDPCFFKGYIASELPGGFGITLGLGSARLFKRGFTGQGKKASKARTRKKGVKKTIARVDPAYGNRT